jgi:hypothetical protein
MTPEDIKKTTLITKTGLYDWTIMPFGLKNATNTFTKTMSTIFNELGDKFVKIFVDDLNIHSENWEEHLQHLDAVLFKLIKVNLKLNPSKCSFATKKSCLWVIWLVIKVPNQILVRLMQYCIFQNQRQ